MPVSNTCKLCLRAYLFLSSEKRRGRVVKHSISHPEKTTAPLFTPQYKNAAGPLTEPLHLSYRIKVKVRTGNSRLKEISVKA